MIFRPHSCLKHAGKGKLRSMRKLLLGICVVLLVAPLQSAVAQRIRRGSTSHPITIGKSNARVRFTSSQRVESHPGMQVKITKPGTQLKQKKG
jgi:hypothetical protein